jgi:hypothetical protein
MAEVVKKRMTSGIALDDESFGFGSCTFNPRILDRLSPLSLQAPYYLLLRSSDLL